MTLVFAIVAAIFISGCDIATPANADEGEGTYSDDVCTHTPIPVYSPFYIFQDGEYYDGITCYNDDNMHRDYSDCCPIGYAPYTLDEVTGTLWCI